MVRRKPLLVGCLLPLVVIAALVGAAVLLTNRMQQSDKDHPAAAPPADFCALVDQPTIDRLVPDAQRDEKAAISSQTPANSDSTCEYGTDNSSNGYATLSTRLLRQGQVGGRSGVKRAENLFDDVCDDLGGGSASNESVKDLGDESCLVVNDGDTPMGYLRVRAGADLVFVDYYRNPSEREPVRDAMVEVATKLLDAV